MRSIAWRTLDAVETQATSAFGVRKNAIFIDAPLYPPPPADATGVRRAVLAAAAPRRRPGKVARRRGGAASGWVRRLRRDGRRIVAKERSSKSERFLRGSRSRTRV